jgi:hypothetical protein
VRLLHSKSLPDRVAAVVDYLSRRNAGRPRTLKTLGSAIRTLFLNRPVSREPAGALESALGSQDEPELTRSRHKDAATAEMPRCSVAVVSAVVTNVPNLRQSPCFDLSCFTFGRKRRSANCRGT